MFGPDLDIHSVQYKRWGWLRWIWLPYRASMHHRSQLSHGPIVGTTLRVLYAGFWLGGFVLVITGGLKLLGIPVMTAAQVHDRLDALLRQWPLECIVLLVGIELGALSHVVSDQLVSGWKRGQRRRQSRWPNSRSKR